MILETERLVLTPFQEGDGALLYPLMSDAEVMDHLEAEAIEDPDEVDATVAAQIEAMAAGQAVFWTIRQAAGPLIGWVQLSDIERRHRQAEVELVMHRAVRGQGLAAEALAAVLAYAATTEGLKRLTARSQVGENLSETLLRKLGFEQLGYVRGRIDRESERRDWRLWEVWL
jgi:ribosomal-protein-alanine N-acetyltransferase